MRILVATDRSDTARHAVAWAADLAGRSGGELALLQVMAEAEDDAAARLDAAADALGAGAVVRTEHDVAAGMVKAAEEEGADVLVVENAGMGGRKKSLLGNVPNRVSHSARCTVVIVNTTDG